jgi:hypothetical protein
MILNMLFLFMVMLLRLSLSGWILMIDNSAAKHFELHYHHSVGDAASASIVGFEVVADGVVLPSGECVIKWRDEGSAEVNWAKFEKAFHTHGHGASDLIWIDSDLNR